MISLFAQVNTVEEFVTWLNLSEMFLLLQLFVFNWRSSLSVESSKEVIKDFQEK